ncbi:MAG: ATP-binding protein [Planctomycetota bacterium]|jgi:signal transduction histidine kinase/ActR/RegA family two-component response regulator
MNRTHSNIGLDGAALDASFPFRFTLSESAGSWGRLLAVGPRLADVVPAARVGAAFEEVFDIDLASGGAAVPERPRGDTPYLLAPKGRTDGFRLRGQFVPVESVGATVFLGAPWVAELDELARFGLSLKDFPPHESIGDMLLLLQTRNTALVELRALATRLQEAATTLDDRNRQLEEELDRRQRLEATLRQVQKMEAVGLLAGGIAHDFNNLMTAILGFASLASEQLPEGTRARTYLDEIQKVTERATALTSQLLTFSRRQVVQPKIVDLSEEVRQSESLLRRLLGEQVRLVVEHVDDPIAVKIDPNALHQIVMNLAVNARDAMPDGGVLTVRTSAVEKADDDGGRWALLEVRDEGCGMSPEAIERVFEPFYTTKSQGQGTGLGLSTVYGIVQQAGGETTIESEVGKGTCFRVLLPTTREAIDGAAAEAASRSGRNVEASILLVEDEPAILAVLETTLREVGFTVHAASDPAAALRQATALEALDVLVSDVGLPGMPGPALAEEIRQVHPSVRTIFMSGYAPDAAFRRSVGSGEHEFMQKPFPPHRLADRIANLVAQRDNKESRSSCTG